MNAADSHGAVDLSATSARQGAEPEQVSAGLHVPLVMEGTEANFQEVMSTSQTVPVVIALWSLHSLESKSLLSTLEDLARSFAGAFQLVTIDADVSPQIAAAFQIQTVPTVVALIGGRPVPLFQGTASQDQIRPLIDELRKAGAQLGVTGKVAVTPQETAPPIPPEHREALALEESGDLDGAITAWQRVIERNPRDAAAKAHLARVRLAVRTQGADLSDPAAAADALFARGDVEAAFALLLDIVANGEEGDKDRARLRLLDLFAIAGNTPAVMKARMRLSTLVLI